MRIIRSLSLLVVPVLLIVAPVSVSANVSPDVTFLKAMNDIMYNTFVEASNVGDQLKQLGSYQETTSDFADFMDTDVWLWNQYIKEIQKTNPKDPLLRSARTEVLNDLTRIKKDAVAMQQYAKKTDLNGILRYGRDMTAYLNKIRTPYSTVAFQMKNKYHMDPNWTPYMSMP